MRINNKPTTLHVVIFYMIITLYSIVAFYIVDDYHKGVLSQESGIFRYIFIASIPISILGVLLSFNLELNDELKRVTDAFENYIGMQQEKYLFNFPTKQLTDYFRNFPFCSDYNEKHGIVYLLQREDGIYKIGRTDNLKKRLDELKENYKQGFTIIKAWYVKDSIEYEKYALQITKEYKYFEETRKELRKMTPIEYNLFILVFDRIVEHGK